MPATAALEPRLDLRMTDPSARLYAAELRRAVIATCARLYAAELGRAGFVDGQRIVDHGWNAAFVALHWAAIQARGEALADARQRELTAKPAASPAGCAP